MWRNVAIFCIKMDKVLKCGEMWRFFV